MGTFGAPRASDATAAEPQQHDSTNDAPQEILDPNDPQLVSEALDVNTEGDAYAFPPPPPDGKYHVKLKIAQPKDAQQQPVDWLPAVWGKANPQKVFVTGVEAGIIDPSGKFDGIKVFDFNVSTFMGRDKSTKVSTILAKLKQPDGQPWVTKGMKLSPQEWMKLLVKALAGEPECGIETTWEWSCQACGQEAKAKGEAYPRSIIGMHKFPQSRTVKGAYDPEMRCTINPAHQYSRARVQIARFLSLSELK